MGSSSSCVTDSDDSLTSIVLDAVIEQGLHWTRCSDQRLTVGMHSKKHILSLHHGGIMLMEVRLHIGIDHSWVSEI